MNVNARRTRGARTLVVRAACSLLALSALSACADFHKVDRLNAASKDEAEAAFATTAAGRMDEGAALKGSGPIIHDRPFIGAKRVSTRNGAPLPVALLGRDGVMLTFERPLTMPEFLSRFEQATGIPTRVKGRVIQEGNNSQKKEDPTFSPLTGRRLPTDGQAWSGSARVLLDQAAQAYDIAWRFEAGHLVFYRSMAKTFALHALAGPIQTAGTVASDGKGGEDGALTKQKVSTDAKLDIWGEIEKTITDMVGKKGTASFSPSTGTIVVETTPALVQTIENYLQVQNNLRLRQVEVAIRAINFSVSSDTNYEFNINALLKDLAWGKNFLVEQATEGVKIGLANKNYGGNPQSQTSHAVLSALSKAGNVSGISSGSVRTLNDQPAPIQDIIQESFLEEVSVSAGNANQNSQSGLKPGKISYGFFANALPRLINDDTVLLNLGIGIKDLVSLTEFSSGDQKIQLPKLSNRGFQQTTTLKDGETLVLAAFEQKKGERSNSGPGDALNLLAGGSAMAASGRSMVILLISTRILPAERMSIVENAVL